MILKRTSQNFFLIIRKICTKLILLLVLCIIIIIIPKFSSAHFVHYNYYFCTSFVKGPGLGLQEVATAENTQCHDC